MITFIASPEARSTDMSDTPTTLPVPQTGRWTPAPAPATLR
jgi:hypothetical protein